MSLPGPFPVGPLQAPATQDLGLRLFQRVTAQVLEVNGTTAVLSIEGFPIVAQLTSSEQAAALLSRNSAQFIITRLTGETMTLKFVRAEAAPQTASPALAAAAPEVAVRLLEQNNFPVTADNLTLARALLKQNLPADPALFRELAGALAESGAWNASQADLAAALKAAGLPVTPQSLALAAQQSAQVAEALGELIISLQSAGQGLPPELLKKIEAARQTLEALALDLGQDPAQVAEKLQAAVALLGRSTENLLLAQAQQPEHPLPEKSLLTLLLLGHELEQAGQPELSNALQKFLADLRHQHFLNIRPEADSGRAAWSEIGFRLQGEEKSAARLRVSRDVSPGVTRLVLQVDLQPGEMVEVDLTAAGQQLRAQVTAPDPRWRAEAEAELPTLEQSLAALGYALQETRFAVGVPAPWSGLPLAADGAPLLTVNIEV